LASEIGWTAKLHAPSRWTRTLRYRDRAALPFDVSAAPPDAPLLLDTTVYVDQFMGDLRAEILSLTTTRLVLHGAPALADLALSVGLLDPADARTASSLGPIHDLLARMVPERTVAPNAAQWVEAAVLAGILARTQGVTKPDRRRTLNDALLFLMAEEAGAVLLSRNVRDFDLLLQVKPGVHVLLYERT
jgi:predicted nucleic acid-binding protein